MSADRADDSKQATSDLTTDLALLRANAVRMTRLADAVPHIVWTMNEDRVPTYFNAKWTEYTDLDLAATLRIGAGTLVHPDDLPAFDAEWERARAKVEPFEVSYRLRRARDGVYRWHVARVVPLPPQDGQPFSWVATATDIHDHRAKEDEQLYLVSASKVLGTSLDLRQTLKDVAALLVPHMADWCAIDLVDESGGVDRQAVAHVDPEKVKLAWELWKLMPPKPQDEHGVYAVVRSGEPEILTMITDELLVAVIPDPHILAIARSLGLRSSMCVPLLVRGRPIGALTLVSAESTKSYGPADSLFATELANRVSVAVDNARLYGAAQDARRAAEAIAEDVVDQSKAVEKELIAMRAERDAAVAKLEELRRTKA